MLSEESRATFMTRFTPDDSGCWVWHKPNRDGYGIFHTNGKQHRAHRLMYEMEIGPIPAGLTIDHLCRNRACINPAHLEPVTLVENVMRGEGFGAMNKAKTHCKYGHVFSPENTGIYDGKRKCLVCSRTRRYLYQRNIKDKNGKVYHYAPERR